MAIPEIGDLAPATAVGRVGRAVFRWSACSGCGKERWVIRNASDKQCRRCATTAHALTVDKSPRWDGGEPELDMVTDGPRLGKSGRHTYVWTACPACSKERWVMRRDTGKKCKRCAANERDLTGERNGRWNGGVRQGTDGYRYITVYPGHPLFEMAGKMLARGKPRYYIAEHRLVMAQHLGRPLLPWELVHHLEEPKDDNRIENLKLLKFNSEHLPSMNVQRVVGTLQARVTLLEAEVTLLRSQLSGT